MTVRVFALLLLLVHSTTLAAAELCLIPSVENGVIGTVDCHPSPTLWPMAWRGYSTTLAPCEVDGDQLASSHCAGFPFPFDEVYGWTISASATDPFVNSGPLSGTQTLFLWFLCSTTAFGGTGMAAAEFGVEPSGLTVSSYTPMNGFISASTVPTWILTAVPGCPTGPVVAGRFEVEVPTPVEATSWGRLKDSYR